MHYSSRVERIAGEGVAAWDIHRAAWEAKRAGRDVIILSVGDPDFATPEPIVARAVAALEAGDTHYTDVPGRPELRAAIAAEHVRRTGQAVTGENVIVVAGAQNGLFSVSQCLFEPGDEVVVLEPMYLTYEATIGAAGARIVTAAQPASNGLRPDPALIARAVTPRTRAIMFANPSNPTGVAMTREELEAIAAIAKENNLWVIVDEVYSSLVFEREHVSLASLPGMGERTITIESLSKSHAMTGWRIGWVVGPKALIDHIDNLSLAMLYGLPGFIQEAAIVAVKESPAITAQMRDIYRRRRDLVASALAGLDGVRCLTPEAGMFCLLDVRGTGLSALDYAWSLFRETGVSVLDAAPFGPSASGFVRVSFTIDEAQLAEACDRIVGFTQRLMRRNAS